MIDLFHHSGKERKLKSLKEFAAIKCAFFLDPKIGSQFFDSCSAVAMESEKNQAVALAPSSSLGVPIINLTVSFFF